MNPCVGRQQYLVTYSRPDESKFSTRESFGKMIETELQALVLLKWTIGLVPDRSTRMMAFTIIVR